MNYITLGMVVLQSITSDSWHCAVNFEQHAIFQCSTVHNY
jgi:hypothetical protein